MAGMSASRSPFEPLTRIGDDVYLYEPAEPPGPDYQGPSLVVMSTWLGGASPKNIGRYAAGHRRLFGSAAVLVVTARLAEITITPFARMHARLQPARDVLVRYVLADRDRAAAGEGPPSPSILWHIFSSGGLNMAIQLARITRQALEETTSPAGAASLDTALGGVIFDCCPGDGSLGRTYSAACYSLPHTWAAQTIGRVLLFPTIAFLLGVQNSGITGKGGSLADLCRGAHDPGVFGVGVRRMYLYSVSDRLVPWRFVNRHMEEAVERGIAVEGEAIPGGGHCALVRGDADRYWRAVERFWGRNEDGNSVSGDGAGVSGNKPEVEIHEMPAPMALLRSRL